MAEVIQSCGGLANAKFEYVLAKAEQSIQDFTSSGMTTFPNASHKEESHQLRNECILEVDVDTSAWEQKNTGFWFDVPKSILALMRSKGLQSAVAIRSARGAWMNQFALAVELRSECKAAEKESKVVESKQKRPARCLTCIQTTKVRFCPPHGSLPCIPHIKGNRPLSSHARAHNITLLLLTE
ncbi:hypothetical protein HD554DRAFT_2177925 [Boletus coccyginus]|nr:hypothetical protein HD554DRAFT_2177925 [Boletus coccyginus]